MDKDQNPKKDPQSTGSDNDEVKVSADDWNKMKSNYDHMNNTLHNLSTKLENVTKQSKQPKPVKHDDTKPAQSSKSDITEKFDKLTKQYNDLNDRLQKQNNHNDVLKQAKAYLKKNNMSVSTATFNQMLGTDVASTKHNIDWFKPIYQKINNKPAHFPHSSHHHKTTKTLGEQLAEDNKNTGAMRNINDCFKN